MHHSPVDSHEICEGIPIRPCVNAGTVVVVRVIRDGAVDSPALTVTIPGAATETVAIIRQIIRFCACTTGAAEVTDVSGLSRDTRGLAASW